MVHTFSSSSRSSIPSRPCAKAWSHACISLCWLSPLLLYCHASVFLLLFHAYFLPHRRQTKRQQGDFACQLVASTRTAAANSTFVSLIRHVACGGACCGDTRDSRACKLPAALACTILHLRYCTSLAPCASLHRPAALPAARAPRQGIVQRPQRWTRTSTPRLHSTTLPARRNSTRPLHQHAQCTTLEPCTRLTLTSTPRPGSRELEPHTSQALPPAAVSAVDACRSRPAPSPDTTTALFQGCHDT